MGKQDPIDANHVARTMSFYCPDDEERHSARDAGVNATGTPGAGRRQKLAAEQQRAARHRRCQAQIDLAAARATIVRLERTVQAHKDALERNQAYAEGLKREIDRLITEKCAWMREHEKAREKSDEDGSGAKCADGGEQSSEALARETRILPSCVLDAIESLRGIER